MRNSILSGLMLALSLTTAAHAGVLRVCADPNNLPFSNRAGEGFENKIAGLIARDLDDTVEYTFAAQHDTFLKRTLLANKCDVVMSVPVGLDEIDETQPYYASSYVFVSRKSEGLPVNSLGDPRLRHLRIGVHLIGDESAPPEIALGEEGIISNVRGYLIYGDYAQPNPAARLIEAVERSEVDVAAVWGPFGGYFAERSSVPLTVTPIVDSTRFAPLRFHFSMAMGVRKGDALRERLNAELHRRKAAIGNILESYGIPLTRKGDDDG